MPEGRNFESILTRGHCLLEVAVNGASGTME